MSASRSNAETDRVVKCFLSIGSNIDKENNIQRAVQSLKRLFGDIECSRVYESEAVGFDGDNFYNLVVGIETELGVAELSSRLRAIEDRHGRQRGGKKFSSRTLDIDILSYGHCAGTVDGINLPRDEITKNAFVLLPLSELAPDVPHPVLQKTYAELWREFDQHKQKLWPVAVSW